MLHCILIKMTGSNLQFETLIKKETPAQVFPCEFYKNFKNIFFKERTTTKVLLSFFCAFFINLCYHTKLNKFGIVGK